jgi:hypothetical protein
VGTACTLFVVPVMYSYLAREHRAPDSAAELANA